MSTTQTITRADQLLNATGLGRCELIKGRLVRMSPSGFRHGRIAATLARFLGDFVAKYDLGTVTGAETGFLIEQNPDTVRAPDMGFVTKEQLPDNEPTGYFVGAPALAIEVLSPGDRAKEVDGKVRDWLAHGCHEIWVVDPQSGTIAVHFGIDQVERFHRNEQIRSNVLRDFRPSVREIIG